MSFVGELVARCLGPTMNAKCELIQKEGGMYALNVRPQEAGEHHLSVTYKGDHIEGRRVTLHTNCVVCHNVGVVLPI